MALAMIAIALAPLRATAAACDATEHRQFDFWLGEWNVHTPDGKLAGVNRISSEYGGCVLHEHYSTSRGEGQTVGADGKVTKHRITWTPNADGSVRQHWESMDEQGHWATAFDGKYTRK